MREGSLDDFSADSTTSPEKIAPAGMTAPFTRVAVVSFASTFVPTGVFPAFTFCRMVTGNSCTEATLAAAEPGAGVFDCPKPKTEPEVAQPSETRLSAITYLRCGSNLPVGIRDLAPVRANWRDKAIGSSLTQITERWNGDNHVHLPLPAEFACAFSLVAGLPGWRALTESSFSREANRRNTS